MTVDIKPDPSTLASCPPRDMSDNDSKPDLKPDLVTAPVTPVKTGRTQKSKKRRSPNQGPEADGEDRPTAPSPKKARSSKKSKAAAPADALAEGVDTELGVSIWAESGWFADKKEAYVARLLADGIKANTIDALAHEVRGLPRPLAVCLLGRRPKGRMKISDFAVQLDPDAGQMVDTGRKC